MNEWVDEDEVFAHLERLCERIILHPEHEWTRDSLMHSADQGWLAVENLIPEHLADNEIASAATASGFKITAFVVETPPKCRQIVTFYCVALNAVVGTAIIDALRLKTEPVH